jgi:hypothetical protein
VSHSLWLLNEHVVVGVVVVVWQIRSPRQGAQRNNTASMLGRAALTVSRAGADRSHSTSPAAANVKVIRHQGLFRCCCCCLDCGADAFCCCCLDDSDIKSTSRGWRTREDAGDEKSMTSTAAVKNFGQHDTVSDDDDDVDDVDDVDNDADGIDDVHNDDGQHNDNDDEDDIHSHGARRHWRSRVVSSDDAMLDG